MMILHTTEVKPLPGYRLFLRVNNGAMGEVDLSLPTGPGPKLWDGCAPEATARPAGAQVTDAAGRALRYDTAHLPLDQGIIVGSQALATLAVSALQSPGGA